MAVTVTTTSVLLLVVSQTNVSIARHAVIRTLTDWLKAQLSAQREAAARF